MGLALPLVCCNALLGPSTKHLEPDRRACTWASDSLKWLRSPQCRRALKLAAATPIANMHSAGCSQANVISRHLLETNGAILPLSGSTRCSEWRSLVLFAVPKAGSSSLRMLVRNYVHGYHNKQGKPDWGEENTREECNDLVNRARKRGGKPWGAMLVREPLARTLSGIREIMTNHHGSWNEQRRRIGLPPLNVSVRVVMGRGKVATVSTGNGVKLTRDQVAVEILANIVAGASDPHVRSQASILSAMDATGLFHAAIRIEEPQDWALFLNASALVPTIRLGKGNVGDRSRPPGAAQRSAGSTLPAAFFELFCPLFATDYACLPAYTPPPECAGRWGPQADHPGGAGGNWVAPGHHP